MLEKRLVGDSIFPFFEEAPLIAAERQLRAPSPNFSEAEAEEVVRRHYGIDGKASLLTGERDRNFLITTGAGASWVLKFYNSADDKPTRALQHGALSHIRARDPDFPVPEIHPELGGGEEAMVERSGVKTPAVLITRLAGVNPEVKNINATLRGNVGRAIGRMSWALSDYVHPRADRVILWNMMLVAELRPLARYIEAPEARASVERWLGRFAAEICPAADGLPHQSIHNDVSLSNLMVDPARRDRVTGVIDFGDMVRAPRINEFAVAASYLIRRGDDLAEVVAEILNGAGSGLGLTSAEVLLLPDLIKARLATRILLSEWRAQLFPENRTYILRSNLAAKAAWEQLENEDTVNQANRLLSLCERVLK